MTGPVPVVDRYDAIQYTGSNEAAVGAAVPQYTFVAETGAGLQFQSGGGTWFCPPNGWIVYSIRYASVFAQFNTTALFEVAYRQLVDGGSIVALQGDLATAETDISNLQTAMSAAQGDISALEATLAEVNAAVLGALSGAGAGTFNFAAGDSTVSVDITPDQGGTGYTVNAPKFFGGISLGALSVVSTSVVDSNTVSVTVNNSGILALGASLLVTVKP